MKCMFQDCPFEATKIIPCKIGMDEEYVDIHVCKIHHNLMNNKSVKVSMEFKEIELKEV